MSQSAHGFDIGELSPSQRLELIGLLWDSIPDNALPIPEWQRQELERRLADADASPEKGIPWEQVLTRLRESMSTLDRYRQIIETVLTDYTKVPYAYGDIRTEAVFDRKNDRYLLMNVGWDGGKRVHGSLVHVDLINGKVWIQRDGTEEGVAKDFVSAGIPKDHIVLAFRPEEVRQYTEYAVA